jgi:lipopolysaccharide biosynthesis glycosyltransferase
LKVVYVLVSQSRDIYEKMTIVSILSLKHFHDNCRVTVFVDESTLLKLKQSSSILLNISDEIISVNVPEGTPTYKSRWIKTQIALFTDPPFLYLDSDTLIQGRLNELFIKCEGIYLAPNHALLDIKNQIFEGDRLIIKAMNWSYNKDIYYNGGIIFFNDAVLSKLVCRTWHDNWVSSVNETHKYRDQPSLNKTLLDANISVKILEIKYNAQIAGNFCAYKNALILHFYTVDFKFVLRYAHILNTNFKSFKELKDAVTKLSKDKKIAINGTAVGDFLLRKLCRNGDLSKSEYRLLNSNQKTDNINFVLKNVSDKLKRLVSNDF